MRGHAAAAGLGDAVTADTCAVTAEAVRQAAQPSANSGAKTAVAHHRHRLRGADQPERFADMPEVDAVIGNADKMRAGNFSRPQFRRQPARAGQRHYVGARNGACHYRRLRSRARAYVQVQNGGDHRCTFCIIPYGRGPSRRYRRRGRDAGAPPRRRRATPRSVLTGVDMTFVRADLPGTMTLGMLVRHILRRARAQAPRLPSIDQVEADVHLMDADRRGAAADAASASVAAGGDDRS